MDWTELSSLAEVLREDGDKVLNGLCKFTLSTKLLQYLNTTFEVITKPDSMTSSFYVLNSNKKIEVFRDAHFLQDFIHRTVTLKLVPENPNDVIPIDLSRFKNLRRLELNKIDCRVVRGLQSLRAQLQFLKCTKCVWKISEILEECCGDKTQGFVWNDLKEIIFSHNNLRDLDSSFNFTPWLNTLDLAHNEIEDAKCLNTLQNLKYLNLGYNKLVNIPIFTGQICNRLQVLILSNNFIEDISGLIVLTNLRELDLGDNCIMQHNILTPLANLAALQWLNLLGNPISYHIDHRSRTAYNLHKNASSVRFLLDKEVLTKSEMKHVGSIRPKQAKKPALSNSGSTSSINAVPIEKYKRTREATISDEGEQQDIEGSMATASSLVTSLDHLDTKRQIEELRERYGATWLHKEGGSLVQNILGMPKPPTPTASTPYEKEFLLHAKEVLEIRNSLDNKKETKPNVFTVEIKREDRENKAEQNHRDSGQKLEEKNDHKIEQKDFDIRQEKFSIEQENKTDEEKQRLSVKEHDNTTEQKSQNLSNETNSELSLQTTTYESATDNLSPEEYDSPYPDENAIIESSESEFDIGSGDDSIYIVTIRGEKDPTFLIVTEKFMAERDAVVDAREKSRWDTERLISCELINDEEPYVELKFDTLRSDRKMRQYIIDDPDEMRKLIGVLRNYIEKRPPDKLTCYKCIKCSSTFALEKTVSLYGDKSVECPNCSSSFVIEEE